jgi:hypothetical protein
MNIRCISWGTWEALQCSHGQYELIAGISAGPRILSLRHLNGANLLYEDKNDFRVGDWRLYGGHRFTIAPESDASYCPDNEPCETDITPAGVTIKAKQRPDGLRLSIQISAAAQGFDVLHLLENKGADNWEGALWAITCIPRTAALRAACTDSSLHYWPGADPENWRMENGQVSVASGGFTAKAGWHSRRIQLAAQQQQGLLVIQSPDAAAQQECTDNGCNTEVYVCAGFMELETLSSNQQVPPGGVAQHLQQWRLR